MYLLYKAEGFWNEPNQSKGRVCSVNIYLNLELIATEGCWLKVCLSSSNDWTDHARKIHWEQQSAETSFWLRKSLSCKLLEPGRAWWEMIAVCSPCSLTPSYALALVHHQIPQARAELDRLSCDPVQKWFCSYKLSWDALMKVSAVDMFTYFISVKKWCGLCQVSVLSQRLALTPLLVWAPHFLHH